MVLSFAACEEYSNIGLEVLPGGDLIEIRNRLIKDDISSFTHKQDSIRTDEASRSLLGSFNDSLFGTTTIDFATQFRLPAFPDFWRIIRSPILSNFISIIALFTAIPSQNKN